ncbi:MAG TPA: hypothetical protein VK926_05355, partial [Gaiellaceae bacterium]|nr:hypothetical protein [Gaiellaceae bacterium]
MRGRRAGPAIDTHDGRALAGISLRTRLVRFALAAGALALLVATASTARGSDSIIDPLLPRGTTGVVVLDLSLSITDDDYLTVRRTLRRLVAEETPTGLVV